ncbi:MAG: hypothetical protein LBB89_07965 [Treponema sp.]|nr:hypothetical protein [Treponema sp.]
MQRVTESLLIMGDGGQPVIRNLIVKHDGPDSAGYEGRKNFHHGGHGGEEKGQRMDDCHP